jgi:hypothetical protein
MWMSSTAGRRDGLPALREFDAVAGRVHHLHALHAGNHFLQTVDEKLVVVGSGYFDGQRHSGGVKSGW